MRVETKIAVLRKLAKDQISHFSYTENRNSFRHNSPSKVTFFIGFCLKCCFSDVFIGAERLSENLYVYIIRYVMMQFKLLFTNRLDF